MLNDTYPWDKCTIDEFIYFICWSSTTNSCHCLCSIVVFQNNSISQSIHHEINSLRKTVSTTTATYIQDINFLFGDTENYLGKLDEKTSYVYVYLWSRSFCTLKVLIPTTATTSARTSHTLCSHTIENKLSIIFSAFFFFWFAFYFAS